MRIELGWVEPTTWYPEDSITFFTSGTFIARMNSAFSFCTIGAGVPAAANTPYQTDTS
jgi:hypothetical protein